VLRAIYIEHLFTPRIVGRVHHREQAPAERPSEAGHLERPPQEQDHRGQRLDPEHRGDPGKYQSAVQNSLGNFPESDHQHGCRPRCIHLPVAVAEPVRTGREFREAVVDALLRLESGPQNRYVLPAHQSCCRCDQVHRGSGSKTGSTCAERRCRSTRQRRRTRTRAPAANERRAPGPPRSGSRKSGADLLLAG